MCRCVGCVGCLCVRVLVGMCVCVCVCARDACVGMYVWVEGRGEKQLVQQY